MRLAVREDLGVGFGESAGSFPAQKEEHRGYDQWPQWSKSNLLQKHLRGAGKMQIVGPYSQSFSSIGLGWGEGA